MPVSATESVAQHSLQHHFSTLEQQRESGTLGMWIFLVTEMMFFGGLFTAYLVYRNGYPEAFRVGSQHMDFWIGTVNTIILLTSSFVVACAVHFVQTGMPKLTAVLLVVAALMGCLFLGLKSVEYYRHYEEGTLPGKWWHADYLRNPEGVMEKTPQELPLFFFIYFVMTGLHALHVTIGVVMLLLIAYWAWKGRYTQEYHNPVHVAGLYWHFVDLVWIFLYPMLYLIANKNG